MKGGGGGKGKVNTFQIRPGAEYPPRPRDYPHPQPGFPVQPGPDPVEFPVARAVYRI